MVPAAKRSWNRDMKNIVNVCRVLFFVIVAVPFIVYSMSGYSFEPQPAIMQIYGLQSDSSAGYANRIIGVWLTEKGDSKVQITKMSDGTFQGKLVWVQAPNEKFTGMEILKDVTYIPESGSYSCPWVYDPKLDVSARATARVSNDTLYLKAKKGIITMNELFIRSSMP